MSLINDEAILDEAENKIRGHSRLVLNNVVAIGEALVDVKSRVPPGQYTEFVIQRLGSSTRKAGARWYQVPAGIPWRRSI